MRAPALVSLLLAAGLALAMGGCAAWTDYAETNTLAEPAGVRFANGCTSGWSLWSGRTCVASSERACTMAPVQRVFAPGRMAPYSFKWTWERDAVGPGTYALVAGLGVDGTLDGGEASLTLVDSRPGG